MCETRRGYQSSIRQADWQRPAAQQRLCADEKHGPNNAFFSCHDVREYSGRGNTQLKVHLQRLEELEYLLVHRGGRGQSFVYELLYDGAGREGETFLCGLIDVDELWQSQPSSVTNEPSLSKYDEDWSGQTANRSGQTSDWSVSSRPKGGGVSGAGRQAETSINKGANGKSDENNQKQALLEEQKKAKSCRTKPSRQAASAQGGRI